MPGTPPRRFTLARSTTVTSFPRFMEDQLRIPNPDRSPAPRSLRLQLASQLREVLRGKQQGR